MGSWSKFDVEKQLLPIIYGVDTAGDKLRNLRLQNKLTIKQLAKNVNISSSTLMHVEQNKIKVPYYYWKLICDYFNTNHVNYLELYTLKEISIQDKLFKIRVLLGARTWKEVGEYLGYSGEFIIDLLTRYTPSPQHIHIIETNLELLKKDDRE